MINQKNKYSQAILSISCFCYLFSIVIGEKLNEDLMVIEKIF